MSAELFHVNLGSSHHTLQFLLFFLLMWFVDNFYSFWILNRFGPFLGFLDPGITPFIKFPDPEMFGKFFQFLDSEIAKFLQLLDCQCKLFHSPVWFLKPAWSSYYWLSDSLDWLDTACSLAFIVAFILGVLTLLDPGIWILVNSRCLLFDLETLCMLSEYKLTSHEKNNWSKSQKVSEILRFENFMDLRFCHDLTQENGRNLLNFWDRGLIFRTFSYLYMFKKSYWLYGQFSIFPVF